MPDIIRKQYEEFLDVPEGDEAAAVAAVAALGKPQGMNALQAMSLERIAIACERIAAVLEAREARETGA